MVTASTSGPSPASPSCGTTPASHDRCAATAGRPPGTGPRQGAIGGGGRRARYGAPRRLYEQALARSNEQIEDIASLAGDDAAIHALVTHISVGVTQYAGLIEAARASNRSGTADANGYLIAAVRSADQLVHGDVAE